MTRPRGTRRRCGPTARSPAPGRKARSTRSARKCKGRSPATAGPSGTTRLKGRSSRSTPCARPRARSLPSSLRRSRLLLKGVGQHFAHERGERRACKVAPRYKAARFRRGGALWFGVEPDIGAIEDKLETKMGEAVLDHARQLAPVRLERRKAA